MSQGKRRADSRCRYWLFERFSGTDETTMWRWLRDNHVDLDTGPTLDLLPEARTVRAWLVARGTGRRD